MIIIMQQFNIEVITIMGQLSNDISLDSQLLIYQIKLEEKSVFFFYCVQYKNDW